MKKFVAVIIAILVISMMSVSVFAAGFDFDSAIAEFEPNAFNSSALKVGATDKPQAYIWLQNGGNIYTSDEAVVTVAADGTVTAVGEGTAYVAIVAATGMSDLYRYDVTEAQKPVSSNPSSSKPTTSEPTASVPTIGATDPDDNASSNDSSCASSASSDKDSSIKSEWEEQDEKIKDKQKEIEEKSEKIMSFSFGLFKGFGIAFIVLFLIVITIGVGGAIYVYNDASKNGLPKIWCLAPLFLFIIGLIVYLAVRSMHKMNGPSAKGNHTVICPTCNCVHPIGTDECSICGRKLK